MKKSNGLQRILTNKFFGSEKQVLKMPIHHILTIFHILMIFFTIKMVTARADSECSVDTALRAPTYHLMEKCLRSNLGMIAKANYTSLTSCQRFGIEKKGLSINFSPPEAWDEGGMAAEYTCEVLRCAEADGGLSLVNDSRYDHYSIYAKPIPHVNSTCVPALGMFFIFTKMMNYTQGYRECKNLSGVPADITTEQRTDALAQLLAGASIQAAFVGLRSKNGSVFVSSSGDGLDCSTYRAWAPGFPKRLRKKYDCVIITRERTWKSTPCKTKYPMLCELSPGGPYKRGSMFTSRSKNDTTTESSEN